VHVTLLSLAIFLAVPTAQRGPSPEEQRLFDAGTQALQAGDPRAAEKAWQAGYAVNRDPAFLVHIGEAQEKAGAPAEAAETYRRYLQVAPDAADRAEIEARLTRLGAAGAPAKPPAAAPPGAGEAPGEFGAGPQPRIPPPPEPRAPAPARADDEPPPAPPPPASGWTRYELTAAISTAAAVTMLLAAGLFAASASSNQDDINRLVLHRDDMTGAPLSYSSIAKQYEDAMADGERNDRYAKLALAGAGAAALVAATFFILDARDAREPAVAIVPSAGGLTAAGTWRF
jgi:hypothetical protein